MGACVQKAAKAYWDFCPGEFHNTQLTTHKVHKVLGGVPLGATPSLLPEHLTNSVLVRVGILYLSLFPCVVRLIAAAEPQFGRLL